MTESAAQSVIEISDSSDSDEEYKPEECEDGVNSASETEIESDDPCSSYDAVSNSSNDSEKEYKPYRTLYNELSSPEDETRSANLRKRPLRMTLKLDSDGNYIRS